MQFDYSSACLFMIKWFTLSSTRTLGKFRKFNTGFQRPKNVEHLYTLEMLIFTQDYGHFYIVCINLFLVAYVLECSAFIGPICLCNNVVLRKLSFSC